MSFFGSSRKTKEFLGRLRWYLSIRWFLLFSLSFAGLGVELITVGVNRTIIQDLLSIAVVIVYNGFFWFLLRFKTRNYRYLRNVGLLLITLDALIITLSIYNNGGVESALVIIYAIPILVTGVLFPRRFLYVFTGLVSLMYGTVLLLALLGIITPLEAGSLELQRDPANVFAAISLYTATFFAIAGMVDYSVRILKRSEEATRAEKIQLEAKKAQDNALISSIAEGIIVISDEGKINNLNPAALTMLGYQRKSQLIGKWFPGTVRAFDDKGVEMPPIKRPIIQALTAGRPIESTLFFVKKNGEKFPAFISIAPIMLKDKPIGAVQIFRDITRERELDKAKEDFVSLVSHQLRTPASGVKAILSVLTDGYFGKMSKHQEDYVKKAYESNERQLKIIEDMLQVARFDSGRLRYDPTEFSLNELIETVVNEFQPLITSNGQRLVLKAPPAEITITADSGKIRMALDNLVNNASKYTPSGGTVTVSFGLKKGRVFISVADTGVGISKEDKKKLFKKFTRLSNPLQSVGGTGLGLYLVKRIADMHHGSIQLSSRVGRGSLFVLSFPRKIVHKPSNDVLL